MKNDGGRDKTIVITVAFNFIILIQKAGNCAPQETENDGCGKLPLPVAMWGISRTDSYQWTKQDQKISVTEVKPFQFNYIR